MKATLLYLGKFRNTYVIIAALYIADVFVSGSGIFSLLFAFFAVSIGVCRGIWAFLRGKRGLGWERLARAGLYICMVLLIGESIKLSNRMANEKMKVIVKAVEAYQKEYGSYPQTLEALAPKFIKGIPIAKVGLQPERFQYYATPQKHSIGYRTSMSGSREYYDFDRQRWGHYQVDCEPPAKDYDAGVTSYLDQPSSWKKPN